MALLLRRVWTLIQRGRGMFLPGTLAAAASLAWSAAAHADHPAVGLAGSGAGPIATIPATPLPQGATAVGLWVEYVKTKRLSDEELQSRAARGIDAHSTDYLFSPSLIAAYGVTDDFTLGLRLPHVDRANIREADEAGTVNKRGDSTGVGDLTVLGRYRFANERSYQAAALFGVKAPTGETGRVDRQGERFETEHQPGSGSWDPMLGFALTRRLGEASSLDASLLYTIATKGAQDTKLGDRASYNLAISYRLGGEGDHHHGDSSASHSHGGWDAVLELNGDWEGKQAVGGITDPESGGNVVYLSPGLRFASSSGWSAYASFGVPIIQHIRLSHGERDYRLISGVSWAF